MVHQVEGHSGQDMDMDMDRRQGNEQGQTTGNKQFHLPTAVSK